MCQRIRTPACGTLLLLLGLTACSQKQPTTVVSEVRTGDAAAARRLLRGFHEARGAWRWTSRIFAVSLDPPSPDRAAWLEMDFSLPIEIMEKVPDVTLVARVNGSEIGRQAYLRDGRYTFTCFVPSTALKRTPAEIEFELDKSVRSIDDGRPLGAIVVSIGLKDYEETALYRESRDRVSREAREKLTGELDRKLTPARRAELIRFQHTLPIWQNVWFQNIQILQNPLDLWVISQIIYEIRPDYIIETGTWQGASALYYAQTLQGAGLVDSRVLTIDVNDHCQAASVNPLWTRFVEFTQGGSTDEKVIANIAARTRGKRTLIVLDSDHSTRHVLAELRLYSPLVSRDSYIVVSDTHIDAYETNLGETTGPAAAAKQFLDQGGNKDFEVDRTREMFVMTWNPGGWLRRR